MILCSGGRLSTNPVCVLLSLADRAALILGHCVSTVAVVPLVTYIEAQLHLSRHGAGCDVVLPTEATDDLLSHFVGATALNFAYCLVVCQTSEAAQLTYRCAPRAERDGGQLLVLLWSPGVGKLEGGPTIQ